MDDCSGNVLVKSCYVNITLKMPRELAVNSKRIQCRSRLH
jgi:hypothetical protein